MAMATTLIQGLLDLIFLNTTFAGVGDATGLVGSTVAGSLYISCHTAAPAVGGSQTTNEASTGAWPAYARQGLARSGSGWSRTGNVMSNAAQVQYAANAGTAVTVTHLGIGTASSGAGKLLFPFPLTSSIEVPVSAFQLTFIANELEVTFR